jgi:UDP-2,3-diacylglucosamine pyrophosphatase LpxH
MIVCAADAHIGEDPAILPAFFEALDRLANAPPTHFIVLGDLFRFFIGLPGWATPEHEKVLARIRKLKEAGTVTAYLEGNRDFFLKDPALRDVFDAVGPSLEIEVPGARVLFVHGDTINRGDRRYRTWRAFSKSRFTYGLTRTLPRPLLLPLYRWTERRLKHTNFQYRKAVPLDAVREFAARHPVDAIILGHFHREFTESVGAVKVFGLPAFRDTRRLWEWEPSR